MNVEIVASLIGAAGIGGIIGAYLKHVLDRRRELDLRIQTINEEKYRSILVYMRCLLKPEALPHFQIQDKQIYEFKREQDVRKYALQKLEEYYYNGFLYASDDVLIKLNQFMDIPADGSFLRVAMAMRKDLWKKGRTKINAKQFSLR